MANEMKKKQLKIEDFEMKEATKEQFDLNNLNNQKLPLGELKNYTTGKSLLRNHGAWTSNPEIISVRCHQFTYKLLEFNSNSSLLISPDSIQNQIPNLFQPSLDYDLFAQSKLFWSYPFYSFATTPHPFDLDSKLSSSLNYYQIKYLTELNAIIKLAQTTGKL